MRFDEVKIKKLEEDLKNTNEKLRIAEDKLHIAIIAIKGLRVVQSECKEDLADSYLKAIERVEEEWQIR
jgi:hypothetical protein